MLISRPAVIAGARPNFPKVAPLLRAFAAVGVRARLVHTGQHYDQALSGAFFENLGIADPDVNLGVGSGSHAAQTAAVMVRFEEWLCGPGSDTDAVLVVGDVNSTLACALVAAKAGVPVGHVEAGLRAFDRTMPEELNRVVVDALATWLFTPSLDADANLRAEGVPGERIHLVGNVMVDSLLDALPAARRRTIVGALGLSPGRYGLVTLHRPALVDDPNRLADMLVILGEIGRKLPLLFPVHPRTRALLERCRLSVDPRRLRLIAPLDYLDFLALERHAALVLTDSGGVQEETSALGVPCLTIRENTERPITIALGTNRLVGFDRRVILEEAQRALRRPRGPVEIPLWDGHACERIVAVLCSPGDGPVDSDSRAAGDRALSAVAA